MNNIVVLNLDNAEEFTSNSPWGAISVVSEGQWPKLSTENRVGILHLAFWDIEELIPGYKRMTEEQAEKILNFADEIWDKAECLLVHCEAGISRSPAIAAAISKIKIGHEGGYFQTHFPNRWVYSTILRVNENRKRVMLEGENNE